MEQTLNDQDFMVDTYSNNRECHMRMTHIPSGLVAQREFVKSRIKAQQEMREELRERIERRRLRGQ